MVINPHAVELTSLVVLAAWSVPGLFLRSRRRFTGRLTARFAAKPWLAAVSVGMAALAIRAALLPIHPVPAPAVMDEYSYLLAGDTFASGRATNPAHPFWVNFETFCELMQPTYASKYPPAQGLILAAGIWVAHSPWIGVWLSTGALCAVMVWMLQGWLPPRWALLGGILVLVRIGIASYWVDSYWGGTAAACGGAMLYGALPRLMRRQRLRDSLVLGAGLAILANSRPFEGLLLAVPAMVTLAAWAVRRGWQSVRPLTPMLAVLGLAALAMLAYNHAVTGSPWRMPYQVHEAQYAVAPLFLFQKLRPAPVYHHAVIQAVWNVGARNEYLYSFRVGLVRASLTKLGRVWDFFLGPLLTVPLIALPWALRSKRYRLIYISLGLFLPGVLVVIDVLPHYAAPATALIYLTVVQCLRYLCASGRVGRALSRSIPVVLVLTAIVFYSLGARGATFLHEHYSWCFAKEGNLDRARIIRELEATSGRHLVIVRYSAGHQPYTEWVFNRADIDGAKVVWAREMDEERNRALMQYFSSRQVWLLEPDEANPQLKPYPAPGGAVSLLSAKP
jgi:hypothetical protein